jgi:hypothetical protein
MLGEFNKYDKIRFACIAIGLCIFIPSVVLFILDRVNDVEKYNKYWQIGIGLLLIIWAIWWINGQLEKTPSKESKFLTPNKTIKSKLNEHLIQDLKNIELN